MGSMSSLIADEEREKRENKRIDMMRHKVKCQETWDKFLKGEAASPLSDILEYAQELDKEVKTLRREQEATERLRLILKGFLNVR